MGACVGLAREMVRVIDGDCNRVIGCEDERVG